VRKLHLIYIFLCSYTAHASAAPETPNAIPDSNDISYWGIQYENDFLGGKSDKYYTQGIEISYAKQGGTPDWLIEVADFLPTYEIGNRHGVTYSLGQKVFSPEDITNPNLQSNDRPYAGYLYGAINYINSLEIGPNKQHVNFIELSIGIIGPSALGEEMQNFLHRLIDTHIAEGWQHQLDDELTLGAAYSHKWRHFKRNHGKTQIEISPHTSIVLGNVYTYAATGIMFRWGQGLKRDMGPPNIRPGFIGSTYFVPRFDPNWYFFFGHELRLVGRNIFLDGNTNVDSHQVEREPLVGDLLIGFAFHKNKMRFAISHMIRSKEFTEQDEFAQYGSLNFTYYY